MPGPVPAPLPDAHWDEARALAIAPLAYGGDTGRRMAATDAVEPLTDTPERPDLELIATLGRGDGFSRVLERAGVAEAEAEHVAAMVEQRRHARRHQARHQHGSDAWPHAPNRTVARPLDALSFRARFDLKLSVARKGGTLVLARTPIAVDETPLRIQGVVGSSLYRAARAAGAPAKAVEAYIRAVAGQIGIGSLERRRPVRHHPRASPRRHRRDRDRANCFMPASTAPAARICNLLQWTQGGRTEWFEASGVGRQSGSLSGRCRATSRPISECAAIRSSATRACTRDMDFRAGYGTPILAAADGRVSAAGWAGGYGQQVRIAHAGGIGTSYSHMSRIVARPGSQVRQGQVIGYVGSTGLSTGPHLHYELRNGVAINPAWSVRVTPS